MPEYNGIGIQKRGSGEEGKEGKRKERNASGSKGFLSTWEGRGKWYRGG